VPPRARHPAFIEGAGGEVITYAELAQRSIRGRAPAAKGIAKGTWSGWSAEQRRVGDRVPRILRARAVVTPMFAC